MERSNHLSLLRQPRTLLAVVVLMLTCVAQTSLAVQTEQVQQEDQKLLDGLRDRKLFDLADDYCRKLLESSEISQQRRATLAVHQLKNLTAKAVFSPSERRQEIWQQIDKTANDFSSSFRGSRGFLVRTQQSLATIAQVRLIRQEIDARLAQPGANQTAISLLRSVRDQLEETIRDIEKTIPQSSPDQTPTDLGTPQLLALKTNLQFQFAICNLERSQLYADDDKANRKDALSQAQEQIAKANRTAEKGKSLWWEAKLASSKCLRLLGRHKEASLTLKTLPESLLPTDLKPHLRIERLKVALASEDRAAAGTLVRQALEQAQRTPPEDIGLVQATLWLTRTSPADQAVKWKALSASLVQAIKSSHGRYWGRRAELVLVESIQDNAANNPASLSVSPDADLLILTQVAQTALKEQRYENAAEDFEKAILLAKRQSDFESILRLSIQQGEVYETLGQHANAANAMIDAAIVKPNLGNAAAAHLRGCWNLSQTISGPDAQQQADRFQKRLEQHLETWPTGSTAESALLLLGERHRQTRNYRSAFDTFLRVPASSERFPQAATKAAAAASNLLLSLEQAKQPLDIMAVRLLGHLREPATKNANFKPFTELLAADIDIRFRSRLPFADTLKEFEQNQLISDNGLAELRLAVQTISKIKDSNAFEKLLGQAKNKPKVQQRLYGYLIAMQTRGDSSNSFETLATAGLSVAQQAADDAQQANQKELVTAWKLRITDLQLGLKQYEPAIESLKGLVNEFPRKADLQIKLAQAMTEAYGRSDPEKAINQWRLLATKLRPETENWFLAKYNVADLLQRSGKRNDALKLLKYMKANPPGWDNSERKSDFDALFQKVN